MHNAAVGAGDEQIIECNLLDAVCGDGKGVGVVAENSAVFTESCGVGCFQNLAGFAVAYKERKRAVVAQMQGDGALLIALVDKCEMVLIFDHPVGGVCRRSAAVGVVVIDNDLFAVLVVPYKFDHIHSDGSVVVLRIEVSHPGVRFIDGVIGAVVCGIGLCIGGNRIGITVRVGYGEITRFVVIAERPFHKIIDNAVVVSDARILLGISRRNVSDRVGVVGYLVGV